MREKRVCIIRHNYYPQESHIRRDAETLRDTGYEVDIICLKYKNQPYFEVVNGVNVYRVPVSHQRGRILRYIIEYIAFFILSFLKLNLLYLKKKYIVIEVDTMPDFLVFAAIIPNILGAKVILYMFENMPELYSFEHKLSIEHPVVRFLKIVEKLSLKFADKIIVTHEPACRIFAKHRIPKSKFAIVLNVPDEKKFILPSSKLSNSYSNEFCLVSHGSILRRYGFQVIIKSLKVLESKIPNLRLLIVGDGEYRHSIEKLVWELNLDEKVLFIGFIPFEQIPAVISKTHIGIVPMLADLMLPNKLFEYIILDIPSIVSDLPTMREYFNKDCVMYFEPGNPKDLAKKILYLYNHPEKRKELVKNSSKVYEKYRWSNMRKKYIAVYEDLIKRK